MVHNSYLEIDLKTLSSNVEKIRKGIGEKVDIIAVVKGNAYGMGIKEIAKHLDTDCGIETFGVATANEGIDLRSAGIKKEILVMGGTPYHNIAAMVEFDLQSAAYDIKYLELLNEEAKKAGKTAQVHIKIETGLNRVGVLCGTQLDELCECLKGLPNVKVVGIFTHFYQSEIKDKTATHEQFKKFKAALHQAKGHGFDFKYVHTSNSNATTWLFDDEITHVRPGALLYGVDENYDDNDKLKNSFGLSYVWNWKCYVTNVKTVPVGETVGYAGAYKVTKPTDVATISIGYADGYVRSLGSSGKGVMIVNGKKVPVIGICMDQMFLDVTGMDAEIGDVVTVLGTDGEESVTVMDLQAQMGQSYLAILSIISGRVARVYKR